MPPEKTDFPAVESAGLIETEIKPVPVSLLPHELDYVSRLVAADLQRMIEHRDHGVSHGMRGYSPPDLSTASALAFSLSMVRTAAAINAIEALDSDRRDES